MARVFLEPDQDRLVRRIAAVTGGDLTSTQIKKVVGGDMEMLKDLPPSSKTKVAALVAPEMRGELEKIVGPTTDFVPIAFLDLARVSAKAVARVIDGRRRPLGTGVMVSPRLFMTNNHVVPDDHAAASTSVQFDYELGVDDVPEPVTEFRLDPATFFWTSPEDDLDVSIIAVGPRAAGDETLEHFGWTGAGQARRR
jgi:endonuclease G